MDAHKALISDIFNNATKVEIPFFQRAYVWKEDLWSRFLEDMEYLVECRKPHFFGSIILKEKELQSNEGNFAKCWTIVDGQQRLTTFLLFMRALSLKQGQTAYFDTQFRLMGKEIALRHGKNDIDAFEKVMAMSDAEKVDDSGTESRIIEAYNYFIGSINPDKLDIITIGQYAQFVKIELNKEEDEQQIFDTINSLGVNLTTSELLKNYFFSRESINDYTSKWENVFEKDDDTKEYWNLIIESGNSKRAMIDVFFDSYFQLFIQDKKYSISKGDRTMYERVDNLALSYQHFIKTYCNGEKEIILDQMKDYANCFMNIFTPSYCDMSIPNTSSIERLNVVIFGLKTSTMIPYILFVAKNVYDEEERNKIYGVLEGYIMRRIVARATTKSYSRLFKSLILNRVLTAESLVSRLNSSDEATTFIPNDDAVIEGFKKSKLTNLQTKGIIYLIESKIRPQNSATALLGFNGYSLEHLMPKKWRNNWPPCETEEEGIRRDSILLTLGNLAIITQALNTSIRDAKWSVKKAGRDKNKPGLEQCAGGIATLQDVLDKKDWNEKEIAKRAERLSNQALAIWKL